MKHTVPWWGGTDEERRTAALPRTAEESLQQALKIARSQQARMWELRTAVSLTRLWQAHGKRL